MNNKLKALFASAGLMVAGAANAALPTEATTAMTDVLANGKELIATAWPVAVAIAGGLVLLKLFKKVINKAT